ncbi:MAG: class I SAM-dependent methyltransferase [Cyanobacteria bacterium P01_H01_bin.58]
MSNRTLGLDAQLYNYLLRVSLREHPVLAVLRDRTATYPMGQMQISPEQGQFMALLIKVLQVKKALELGVFTGYSSLAVALALPPDGQLVACDISEEHTAIAREFWEKAGVQDKINLRIGPALETLDTLIAEGAAGSFDFVFIDADKRNYDAYYEKSLVLVKTGGMVAIDNVLWYGRVADPTVTNQRTERIRDFNQKLHQDERIDLSLVPIGDGLTLAVKR